MTEVYIKVIDMDTCIKEQVTQNQDGSYTIFLNARHSFESHMKSYIHAMEHIVNKDFDSEASADQIEKIRHAV